MFDYLLVLSRDCSVRCIEIHPASSTGEVDEVIGKKKGTEQVLTRMGVVTGNASWHWIVHGKGTIKFKANDRYGKKLAQEKIAQPKRTF